MDSNKGYVYILTNPSFREDWVKIGKSSRPVDVRSKELDNTAVPLPFDIYATMQTSKYTEVEKLIHKTIDRLTDLRIRQNREFFNVQPEMALDILNDIALTIDDAEIYRYVEHKPVKIYPVETPVIIEEKKKNIEKKRTHFTFDMVGLPIGTEIVFDATGQKVKIATDCKIEYQDRLWSLSGFTAQYLPEDKQTASRAYQGPKFFSYNGKTMWQLRLEKENK
ncbi:MAG: GIY-YIG nuclease family protein [Prevotella sp.]|nr:GIY-YIG nuclease family protein [Candidatus Equicola faecalis]